MTTIEKIHKTISNIRQIKDYPKSVQKVIIFGSCARNDIKATSDIDICIVGELHSDDKLEVDGLLHNQSLLDLDILFATEEQLETIDSYNVFYYVKKEGVVIYENIL